MMLPGGWGRMNKSNNNAKSITDYLQLGFKGFCMGVADIIPGVSGGTIAFILGIYEDLIKAIKSFDAKFARHLCTLQFKRAFGHASWQFLGTVLLGILTAIFTLSKVMHWLLHNKPVYLHAFFFGLILATVPIIGRRLKRWNIPMILLGLIIALAMFFVVGMMPIHTPESMWFLFLSGAIAICAMILPGISGAFILVLLGKYQFIIEAVSQRDFAPLMVVAAGCIVGILSFVRVLNWLLSHHHDLTVAVLTGLVLGSLRKVWPFKEAEVNVLPPSWNPEIFGALALLILGFSLAILLGRSAPKKLIQ